MIIVFHPFPFYFRPLNMLDSYKNRNAYVLSFCLIASQLFLTLGKYEYIFGSELEKVEKGFKYLPREHHVRFLFI